MTCYYIQEFTCNVAALVESVSPMFVSLLIAQLCWLNGWFCVWSGLTFEARQ